MSSINTSSPGHAAESDALLLRAKVALTAGGIIQDAGIAVANGLVSGMGRFRDLTADLPSRQVRDLGEVALLPGFVNAHCHLELTHLRGKVPFNGSFIEWLATVGSESRGAHPQDFGAAAEQGVAQTTQLGTAAVGDVSLWGHTYPVLADSRLGGVLFSEAIGLEPRLWRMMFWWARRRVARSRRTERLRPGISPHAPYSTSAELYRACVALAQHWNLPIMTHAAETREEDEFLRKGTGPLMDLVRERGWLEGKWEAPGKSPVEYVGELGVLTPNTLLAHLNYPSTSDIDLVAKSGASVAFCPRSHRFFRHDPYPLPALLSAAINVCLGTDSLASNDSLSVLEEARSVAKDFPQLSPSLIFAMATTNGARALGLEGKVGEIVPGAWASFLALEISPLGSGLDRQGILEFLLRSEVEPSAMTL